MRRAILLTPILLTACDPPSTGMPPVLPGKCVIGDATQFVGRVYTAATGKRAMRVTGARTVRVIHPGQMVTMDFREDRLNIRVDSGNRVLTLSCG